MTLLEDSLGRLYFSIPILHTSLFYLSEPDLVETQKTGANFAFPNSSPQSPPQPHTFFAEPRSLPEWQSQLSVQGSFGDYLGRSTHAQYSTLDLLSQLTVN